ncbi:unnamed protein product [Parnassius apollo]|uniref:(apollo) hypothetical protein n=1 Tax=Parnassius apollo TaxID=110799 RepID=A0A8S3X373_PARAO|nr:unnamed protein product [Parnassius apollo]
MSRHGSNPSILQRARCNRIFALLPERNAQSDGSELSDVEEEEFFQPPDEDCFSSSPPSVDSSLERMNILDSDDEDPSSVTPAALSVTHDRCNSTSTLM